MADSINNLRRVRPGVDRPSAGEHNTIVGFLQGVARSGGANAYVSSDGQIHHRAAPARPQPSEVMIRNDSGVAIERGGVLGVDGIVEQLPEQPGPGVPALIGVAPTAEHVGRFAVLLAPAADGAVVRAAISGTALARVNMQAEGDPCADVADGVTGNLVSGSEGASQILWAENGTGVVWALVRFGAMGGGPISVRVVGISSISQGYVTCRQVQDDGTLIGGLMQVALPPEIRPFPEYYGNVTEFSSVHFMYETFNVTLDGLPPETWMISPSYLAGGLGAHATELLIVESSLARRITIDDVPLKYMDLNIAGRRWVAR